MFRSHHQKIMGITLIEIMITMLIGTLLVSFILGIYLTVQETVKWQLALQLIQENAKTAFHILSADMHKAGYIGCANLANDFTIQPYPPYSLTMQNKLTGTSSSITSQFISANSVLLREKMRDQITLYTTHTIAFSKGDILFISDCKHAEFFQVKEVVISHAIQQIIANHALHYQYAPYAEISRFTINRYFVDKTKRTYADGSRIYSLFLEDINQHKIELVEGIRQMQIQYVIKMNDKIIKIPAEAVPDWATVVGVSIKLTTTAFPLKKIRYLYVAL